MDGLVLLSVLLAQGLSAPTNDPLQVEASLALGGYVSNEGFSELHVRALSSTGGTLLIDTHGATPATRIELELIPNEVLETWLPLRVDLSASRLSLDATLNPSVLKTLTLDYGRRPLPRLVLVGPRAVQRLSHLPDTEPVSATELPRIAETYSQISALAIDSQTLAAMDERQLRSLLEYVGTCGRVLLIDASPAVGQAFANRAACEGRFLVLPGDEENMERSFVALADQANSPLPTEQSLERLLGESPIDAFNWTRLAFLLAGYLIILIVLLTRSRTYFVAIGFSVVSTVLVVAIWPAGRSRDFVAWAEMASTEQVARYVRLERNSATRRKTFTLLGNGFDFYPVGSPALENYSLHWGAKPEQRRATWKALPFQQLDRISRGSFAVNATLQLELRPDSAGICNSGITATKPMVLQWQGSIYEVPPLDAGSHWSSVEHVALQLDAEDRPELELLLDRSTGYPLTVLQSLPIPGAQESEQAWLLRYQTRQTGRSSCAS